MVEPISGPGVSLPPQTPLPSYTKAAKAAQKRFQQGPPVYPKTFDGFATKIETKVADYNPVLEVITDAHDLARNLAVRVDKVAGHFFAGSNAWQHFFMIDAGVFNVVSLFRRGVAFGSAVREATNYWAYCNFGERLSTLSDLTFKGIRVGESALSLSEKVISVLQFIVLSMPLACIGIITSTILAMKSLVLAVKLEIQRRALVHEIGNTGGKERLEKAMAYCDHYEQQIKDDNDLARPQLIARGAPAVQVERFLDTRKKWALTGIFGAKGYALGWQEYTSLKETMQRIRDDITALGARPSTEGKKQIAFLEKRMDALVVEGNRWVDKFINAISAERAQQCVNTLTMMMLLAVSTVTLAATLVTIQYWGVAVMVVAVVAAFISLMGSVYTLWQRQKISWQEKEDVISLMVAHLVEKMEQSKNINQIHELAHSFGFNYTNLKKDVLIKQFEEHLKSVLHQEKVEQFIDRKFINTISEQLKTRGARRAISSAMLGDFEKEMTAFFHRIVKANEIEQNLIDVAANASNEDFFVRIADTFYLYLNQLCPDMVAQEPPPLRRTASSPDITPQDDDT